MILVLSRLWRSRAFTAFTELENEPFAGFQNPVKEPFNAILKIDMFLRAANAFKNEIPLYLESPSI